MPAWATANRVMASAKRLIEVRHRCRKRSRIAEIKVPAWPIPIHQTKLRMSMPQAMGMLTPHKPMPTNTRLVIASSISWKRAKEMAKPKNHVSDVLRVKTIELILSVTDANVRPGSITGDVECIGPSIYVFCSSGISWCPICFFSLSLLSLSLLPFSWCRAIFQVVVLSRFIYFRRLSLPRGRQAKAYRTLRLNLRIRILQLRQICCPRPRVQFLQERVIALVRLNLLDTAVWFVACSNNNCICCRDCPTCSS